MLGFSSSGSFKNTDSFLRSMMRFDPMSRLHELAQEGVAALQAQTPQASGLTADSWGYEIVDEDGFITVWWTNTNVIDGFNVAIGIQYGHGTGTGGWVAGQDYMNPALQPIFDKIADEIWKEVQKA